MKKVGTIVLFVLSSSMCFGQLRSYIGGCGLMSFPLGDYKKIGFGPLVTFEIQYPRPSFSLNASVGYMIHGTQEGSTYLYTTSINRFHIVKKYNWSNFLVLLGGKIYLSDARVRPYLGFEGGVGIPTADHYNNEDYETLRSGVWKVEGGRAIDPPLDVIAWLSPGCGLTTDISLQSFLDMSLRLLRDPLQFGSGIAIRVGYSVRL